MKELTLKAFYAQSLALTAPWSVVSVSLQPGAKEVHLVVACERGVAWVDPESGERAEIKDWHQRTWRHLDTCDFQTIITASVPRIRLSSGQTMMVSVPWAAPGSRFTCDFESYLIELLQHGRTVRGAARMARVTDDLIDGVMQRAVARGLLRRAEAPLRHLALDEKAIRKGQRYATILSDIDGGRVLDVIEERTQEATLKLLSSQPAASLRSVEAIAMDMWPAYIGACEKMLPEVSIVFDRFHIKKHLNEAVDKVRRQEHRSLSAAGNLILSGSKYLWLKTHGDLRQRSAGEFRKLLVADLQTGTAWALKENFDRVWSYTSWSWAMRFLSHWSDLARQTGLKPLEQAAAMITRHAWGILNYVYHRITNAAAEGINSIIQNLKHAARGLPNFRSFRTRILFFLGKLDLSPA